jgi:hypothetical protein
MGCLVMRRLVMGRFLYVHRKYTVHDHVNKYGHYMDRT